VLEAMALETPIVATSAGGSAEIVRDRVDGLIVPIADRQALIGAMREAIADGDSTRARVKSARARIETTLSFETRMQHVEAIYVELMQRQSPAKDTHLATAQT